MHRPVRRALSLVATALAAAVVAGTALVLTGQYAVVATHGISMNPVYYQGDLVVVGRQDSYRPGQIVAYRRPDLNLVVLHRIIGGTPTGYVFKGDNNKSVDPTRPMQAQLIGRAVLHIPQGGTWLRRLTAPPFLPAYAFLLLMGGGGVAATTRRRHRRKDCPMPPRHRARRRRPDFLPAALHGTGVGAATLGIAGLAVSALAWTRPAAHTVSATTPDRSTMAFSYTAHVPRSAAYDGTTVTAPQPVFRRLATSVDVSYRYTGRPGRLTSFVQLDTSSGWSTRIPIGQTTVGTSYNGTVRLDLPSLERRAAAAASVTGVPMGQVTVAVVPAVHFDAGGTFSPRLELDLEPLVLKPQGDLTASSPLSVGGSRTEPAQLSLLGRSFAVSTGRTAGAAAVGLGALLAALWAVGRRATAREESDRIHARYGDLMLRVLPMPDSGRTAVEVPDVASLARLADRYGVLILHWSQDVQHTYVVEVEGTTYRCHVGTGRRPSGAQRDVAA